MLYDVRKNTRPNVERNTPRRHTNAIRNGRFLEYGVGALDQYMTINGVTKASSLRYFGGEANSAEIQPADFGEVLALQAGAAPTYNDGSPLSACGPNNDSVRFNAGGYYKNATAVNQIETQDFVIELICKGTDLTQYVISTKVSNGYSVYTSISGTGNVRLNMDDAGGNVNVLSGTGSLPAGSWGHVLFFVNRDEASVNGSQCYVNGVASGVGVDVSAISGTLLSTAFALGAATAGGVPTTTNLAYAAMWKHAAWMQAGAAAPAEWATIAANRYAQLVGPYTL